MVDSGRRVGHCARRRERQQHDPLDSAEPIPGSLMGIAGFGEREVDGGVVLGRRGWPGAASRPRFR
jgi:hypothetical protein